MKPRNRFIQLTSNLPESVDFPVFTCNHCAGEGVIRKSVVVLEHKGKIHRYYGLCAHHAEVSKYTFEWKEIS